jgi:AcrR family transcriptional regulator
MTEMSQPAVLAPHSAEGGGRGAATRVRILDAAEELFAESGFAATSLRQITAKAGVNLAAINYHFQSKDVLIVEVLRRKMEPIERRRLELLEAAERAAGGGPPVLEDILRALLQPVFEARQEGTKLRSFPRLIGRIYTEPGDWVPRVFGPVFAGLLERFTSALERALPDAGRAEIAWGMHFAIGSMAHYLAAGQLLRVISGGAADPTDAAGAMERIVRYICGGLRALEQGKRKEAGR